MRPLPLVSVIIPTFDRSSTLGRALKSVLNQKYSNWELIVVDDGSTDQTRTLYDQFFKETSLTQRHDYFSIPHSGVSAARNFGAEKAKGRWLAFLDSDDEWLPEKLLKQIERLLIDETVQLLHAEEIWFRNGIRVNPKKKYKKSGGLIFRKCVDHCCVSTSTVMIGREYFLRKKGFREDFIVCEDYELWLRASLDGPFGFIETPLAIKYGGHPDQLSTQFHSMDYFRLKALFPFLKEQQLGHDDQKYVANEVLKKCEILVTGINKRKDTSRLDEILKWKLEAEKTILDR